MEYHPGPPSAYFSSISSYCYYLIYKRVLDTKPILSFRKRYLANNRSKTNGQLPNQPNAGHATHTLKLGNFEIWPFQRIDLRKSSFFPFSGLCLKFLSHYIRQRNKFSTRFQFKLLHPFQRYKCCFFNICFYSTNF